jgi:predicted AlkP superfamily pyrophosphatase or phosphodiesterase
MMSWSARVWIVLLAAISAAAPGCSRRAPNRHLLIVVDGLRPDYVTPDIMPTLTALARRGTVFNRHHAVYPTVTRVNASSISTGSYPEAHGLMGNSVFFPKVNPARFLDTSDRGNLVDVAKSEGRLLTAPTLGELLQTAGRRMLVVSSGSTGSSFLNNHTVSGGAVLHYRYVLPESLAEDMKVLGAPPGDDAPAGALDRFAVDAFLEVGLPRVDPSVTVMWLSDLDSTAHDKGIGEPATVDILRHVDAQLARIEERLKAVGLFDTFNIWVTSDHGFSTHSGEVALDALLKPYAGSLPDGSPRIVAGGGAIYVRDGDQAAISGIVAALQRTPGIGAIFTRAKAPLQLDGTAPGTLSFDVVRWDHDRSAQILFSPDWTDEENAHGFRGIVSSGGVAGHGSASPWDVHNTLIAAGPDLKAGVTVESPSGNVDFAPTFLTLLRVPVPATMQGRPLLEALRRRPDASAFTVTSFTHTARTADGTYAATAMFSTVSLNGAERRYFDGAKVFRPSAEQAR